MALADEPFFSVGAIRYLGAHVVAAGRHWGDWTRLETEVGDGLACVARAEDTGENLDDRELDAAAMDFRYARDLVSQEEMESWLAAWSLSVERVQTEGWRPATAGREDESAWLEAVDQGFHVFRETTLVPTS